MEEKRKSLEALRKETDAAIERGLAIIKELTKDCDVKPSIVGFVPAWFMDDSEPVDNDG